MGIKQGLLLIICLVLSFIANAEKVVVFNPETAMFSTQAAKQLSAKLSQQLEPQVGRLQSIGDEIQSMQLRRSEDQTLMSADELEDLNQKIHQQTLEFKKIQQYINGVKSQNEQAFMESIRPKLDQVMRSYIEDHGVDVVINASSIVYAGQGVNITPLITAMLDQE